VDTKQCVFACHKHLKGCQYGTRLSMYVGSGGVVWWYTSTYTFKCGGARSRVSSNENWLGRHSSWGNYTWIKSKLTENKDVTANGKVKFKWQEISQPCGPLHLSVTYYSLIPRGSRE
jgi:hypothetical protein